MNKIKTASDSKYAFGETIINEMAPNILADVSLLREGAVTDEPGQSDPDEYFTCRLHATVHFKLIPALIPAPNPRQWLNFLKESKTDGSLSLTT